LIVSSLFALYYISFIDNQNTWERSSDNLGNYLLGKFVSVSLRVFCFHLFFASVFFIDGRYSFRNGSIDWTVRRRVPVEGNVHRLRSCQIEIVEKERQTLTARLANNFKIIHIPITVLCYGFMLFRFQMSMDLYRTVHSRRYHPN
jgi:hypothetical protein